MDYRVAVMVDGDNVAPRFADDVRRLGRTLGRPDVLRVYGNALKLPRWGQAPGYRLVHSGEGKNATDLLLAIETMDLVLRRAFPKVLIASSDGDFSHLALHLRGRGVEVTRMGEAKAPAAFRAGCAAFHLLEAGVQNCVVHTLASGAGRPSELDRQIRAIIAQHSKDSQGMPIVALNHRMRAEHGTRISSHRERTWRAYLAARGQLYDLDPRGPEAKVRFKPLGFAAAP